MDFSKYLGEVGLTELWNLMLAHMDERLFIGTRAEYEAAIGSIPVGAMVVITDESDVVLPPVVEKPSSTIAILGIAKLGEMILGKE
jgi:hypothetical protein